MSDLGRIVRIVFLAIACLIVFGVLSFGLGELTWYIIVSLCFLVWLVLDTFLRYRMARQSELLNVIASSARVNAPLVPAIEAYLADRPHGALYGTLVALLQHLFVAPLYYFIWHRGRSFDDRVARLTQRLIEGETLSEAIQEDPALAHADARIAVAIGERIGDLATPLRRVDSVRSEIVWNEFIAKLAYPMLLLLTGAMIVGYVMVSVMPKLKKIADEFKIPMPAATRCVIDIWTWIGTNAALVALGATGLAILVIMPAVSPDVRWHLPLIGGIDRSRWQGLVLRALGMVLEAGRTPAEGFELLTAQQTLPGVLRSKIKAARSAIDRGEPLGETLTSSGLAPRSMAPLLSIAERTGGLPGTLTELGWLLDGRAERSLRWITAIVLPLLTVAIGVLFGFIAYAFFVPLVHMILGVAP